MAQSYDNFFASEVGVLAGLLSFSVIHCGPSLHRGMKHATKDVIHVGQVMLDAPHRVDLLGRQIPSNLPVGKQFTLEIPAFLTDF